MDVNIKEKGRKKWVGSIERACDLRCSVRSSKKMPITKWLKDKEEMGCAGSGGHSKPNGLWQSLNGIRRNQS